MTLLSPWWLIALSAGSVPILIHLLNRFRHRTVDWAAMIFLYRAMSKQRRRLEIETLILLVVRTLAVLALALAMTRPLATGRAAALAGSAQKRLAVLIDVSASMSAPGAKQSTLFENALSRAREVIARTSNIGQLDIITFADRPKIVYRGSASRFSADSSSIFKQIKPGFGEGSPANAIDAALDLAMESPEASYTIIMVTDAQRTNWARTSKNRWGEITGKALDIENTPALVVLKLTPSVNSNLTVTNAHIPGWSLISSESVEVIVEVANKGKEPVKTDLSIFEGEENPIAPEVLELDGGRSTQVAFSLSRDMIKTGRIRCELGEDEFPADNTRHLVFNINTRPKILVVNGEPSNEPSDDEVFRLRTLLSPASAKAEAAHGSDTIGSAELKDAPLGEYAVVILANVPPISAANAKKLRAITENGASVFFFLGDKIDLSKYNAVLGAKGAGLLPMVLKKVRLNDAVAIRIPETAGQFFTRFNRFGIAPTGVRVASFIEIDRESLEKGATVLAEFTDAASSAAIIQKRIGEGWVYWVTTTVDNEWGNLLLDPAGAVLIHELICEAASSRHGATSGAVGRPIRFDWPLENADGNFVLSDPKGIKTQLQLKPVSRRFRGTIKNTALPGFYTLTSGKSTRNYAANVSPSESDFTTLRKLDIEKTFPCLTVKVTDETNTARAALVAEGEYGALWPLLLAAALILFVIELALAQHFSRMR